MKIINFAQHPKYPNLAIVRFDDGSKLSLDQLTIANMKLFSGMEVDSEILDELKKIQGIEKLRYRLYAYIARRPRSIKEVEDYFKYRVGIDVAIYEPLIVEFKEKGLLNDENFANWFVGARLLQAKYGENRIRSELKMKGIDNNLINSIFKDKAEELESESIQTIRSVVEKYIKQNKLPEEYEKKQKWQDKIYRRLISRGYEYEKVRKIMQEYLKA